MPEGPGAEELEVGESVAEILATVMGERGRGGRERGSVGREGSIGGGLGGKKRERRVEDMSTGSEERPVGPQRGGMTEERQPWRQRATCQRDEESQ